MNRVIDYLSSIQNGFFLGVWQSERTFIRAPFSRGYPAGSSSCSSYLLTWPGQSAEFSVNILKNRCVLPSAEFRFQICPTKVKKNLDLFELQIQGYFSESWTPKRHRHSIFTQKGTALIVAFSAGKSLVLLKHRFTFCKWNLWKFKSLLQAITGWEKTTAFATDASGCLTRKPKNLSKNWKEKQKYPGIKTEPEIT